MIYSAVIGLGLILGMLAWVIGWYRVEMKKRIEAAREAKRRAEVERELFLVWTIFR